MKVTTLRIHSKSPKRSLKTLCGMRGARKDDLTAIVFVKPIAARYLLPYEEGGDHVLPGRALLNPKDIKLNANGQLPRGILARLKARPDIFIGPVQTKTGPVNGVVGSESRSPRKAPKRAGAPLLE